MLSPVEVMNLVCVRLLNEALCVFVSFLDTFETFCNAELLVFIHISLIFMVHFRKFRGFDRKFRARGR